MTLLIVYVVALPIRVAHVSVAVGDVTYPAQKFSTGKKMNLNLHSDVDASNFSFIRPLVEINHAWSGRIRTRTDLPRTFMTNFGNSHLRVYQLAARDHNNRAGREEIVISDKAFDCNGTPMPGNSSVHMLNPDPEAGLQYFWDRRLHWIQYLGVGEFSRTVLPKPVPTPIITITYVGPEKNEIFVTNFMNKDRAVYVQAINLYNKKIGENRLFLGRVIRGAGDGALYDNKKNSPDGVWNLSDFWTIFRKVEENLKNPSLTPLLPKNVMWGANGRSFHNSEGYTFYTNVSGQWIEPYRKAINDYNASVGRTVFVMDDIAYDASGGVYKAGKAIHCLLPSFERTLVIRSIQSFLPANFLSTV